MTVAEVKVVVTELVEKLKVSIEKEGNYLKELSDDQLLLNTIQTMQGNGDPLPAGTAYSSFEEWVEQINKEIKSTDTSLVRIDKEKAELVAFEYYIANATE